MSCSLLASRSRILVVGAAGLALVVAAAGARPAGSAARGGVLRIGSSTGLVDSLDPALAYMTRSWEIEFATCAKLFNHPDKPGDAGAEVVSEVVRRTTVSKDLRTYTFDLERTFRFQTGAPVNAAAFAEALNRDADPKLRSPAVFYMHEIAGADAVVAGEAATISGVRVLGPYRLRIQLIRPQGDLPARLTMPFFCPVPPGTPRHELDLPPGSGPYYVSEHVANKRIVLRRNPYYRGDRRAYVDRVDWRLDVGPQDCVAAIEQDEVDTCAVPEAEQAALARKYGVNRPGGRYFVAPELETSYLAFNHDRPAFKGPGQIALAKAINYAIDRRAIAAPLGALGARRTDRMLPPAIGRAEHLYPIAGADPVTARTWLAKAKLAPKKLVLYTFNNQSGVHLAEILAYDLRQLGIELEARYFSPAVMFQKAGTRGEPFDIVLVAWAADYADAATFFVPLLDGRGLRATGNSNYAYLDDPRVNAAIDAADRLSGTARRTAFADLDAALMRDSPPWAPLVHLNARTFVSASVGCFFTHPVAGIDLAAVCKK